MSPKRMLLGLIMVALVLGVSGSAWAAKEKKDKEAGEPSGRVTIKITEVGLGVGVTWGEGTLTFKGKKYKFKVKGLNAIAVGVSSIEARGEVYNLQKLDDFAGKYVGTGAGAALVKGSAGLVVKNYAGVVLNLKASQTGLELKLANEGLSITPAWD
jgi:hypothetical protein